MFAVPGMLLDGSACPCEPATACWANGIFRENLGQSLRELAIKFRNVGVRIYNLPPTWDPSADVRPFGSGDVAAARWWV